MRFIYMEDDEEEGVAASIEHSVLCARIETRVCHQSVVVAGNV